MVSCCHEHREEPRTVDRRDSDFDWRPGARAACHGHDARQSRRAAVRICEDDPADCRRGAREAVNHFV